jgi:CheY-like chemotaxis protein
VTLATSTSELFSSLSGYLWPLIVGLLLWKLYPVIRDVLRSRSYTINVGGFSITVQEASENLHELIADLQDKVVPLAEPPVAEPRHVSGAPRTGGSLPEPTASDPFEKIFGRRRGSMRPSGGRVLWVDDKPENNAYEIQTLKTEEVPVVTALTTAEGLRLFGEGGYVAVITDFGRVEDGKYQPAAGRNLVQAVRGLDHAIPIFVFTTSKLAEEHRTELIDAGASAVTASTVELLAELGAVGARPT